MAIHGVRNIKEMAKALYGGYRPFSMIQSPIENLPCYLDDPAEDPAGEGTDICTLVRLVGRPWPTQLLLRADFTHERCWRYALEMSSKLNSLRFCPGCARNQVESCGRSWWRLDDNLPGVCTCSEHQTPLVERSWEEVTTGWGMLPHQFGEIFDAAPDDIRAIKFSEAIREIQRTPMRYCPMVIALLSTEQVRINERCPKDEAIGYLMDRFAKRFPRDLQARIGINETTPVACQVESLVKKAVVKSPLATILTALSAFPDLACVNYGYNRLLEGSQFMDFGEINPTDHLSKMALAMPNSNFHYRMFFH
jgi:hypothetical protein